DGLAEIHGRKDDAGVFDGSRHGRPAVPRLDLDAAPPRPNAAIRRPRRQPQLAPRLRLRALVGVGRPKLALADAQRRFADAVAVLVDADRHVAVGDFVDFEAGRAVADVATHDRGVVLVEGHDVAVPL